MSLPRYSEYKDSGIDWLGCVPAHWTITKTKYVCQFSTGWTPPTGDSSAYEGENLWATISDLGPKTISDTAKRISDAAAHQSGIHLSPQGSLLFSFKLSIGQVSFAGRPTYTNEAIATFRPSPRLSLDYAYYAFPLFLVQNASENIYGAKLLNQELIRGASFSLPPPDEQTAIATFLDHETGKIDTLIAEQEQLIALLAEKRQATISHAVTKGLNPDVPMKDSGVAWLGKVPAHWEIRSIAKATTKITNGYVGPTRDILIDDGVPYVQATHIKGGRVNFGQDYFVSEEWSNAHAKSILGEGDVLIVQTGAGTGDVGLVSSGESGFNCHALIILSSEKSILHGSYLAAILESAYGRAKLASIQTGAMHPHLNCGEVKFVEIPLPPVKEQTEIMALVKSVTTSLDALAAEASQGIALLKERRSALIAAAVTGQIDVRKAA